MPLPYTVDDPFLQDILDELDKRTAKLVGGLTRAQTVMYGKSTLATPASSTTPSVLNIDPGLGGVNLTAFLAQGWPLASWSGFQTAGATTNGSLGSVALWTIAQNVLINWVAVI